MTQQKGRSATNRAQKRSPMSESIAARVTEWVGSGKGLTSAVAVVVLWAASGPLFGWSNTWQLVINTGTTIVTFLMVFLIQRSQNKDGLAIQLKLDELIRAMEGAHNALLDLEELPEQDLEGFRKQYQELARKARADLRGGKRDTDTPEVAGR